MSFLKKKKGATPSVEELSEMIQSYEEKQQILSLAIRALLHFIKDFSHDLEEIGAKRFKDDIDELNQKILSENKPKKLQSIFENYKNTIQLYIKREKEYFRDREIELKNIIDLLSNAIATLNTENQDFNQIIYKQSEKIEQITLLDDIKKIKTILKQEIDGMRKAIRDKELHDTNQIETLSIQVSTLKNELAKAQTESSKDGLTGICNRLALDKYLRDIVERNTVTKSPFSLLMIDIDNFKHINDTYGHQTGDRIIIAMVQKCKEFIRKDDFFARYGGEEFVIILPGASLRNAIKKATSMCKSISKSRYSINDKKNGPILAFTISIGVSSHIKGDTTSSITDRADQALYSAKQSGKNRVISKKVLK